MSQKLEHMPRSFELPLAFDCFPSSPRPPKPNLYNWNTSNFKPEYSLNHRVFVFKSSHWRNTHRFAAMASLNMSPEELKQLELLRNRFAQLSSSLTSLRAHVMNSNPLPT
jgi:hypothetical protein